MVCNQWVLKEIAAAAPAAAASTELTTVEEVARAFKSIMSKEEFEAWFKQLIKLNTVVVMICHYTLIGAPASTGTQGT